MLDIGCGRGQLLSAFKSLGAPVLGLERQEFPVDHLHKNFVRSGSIDDREYADSKFDIVILWHVLEHVEEPAAFLEQVRSRMTGNGTIMIAAPNASSHDASIYGADWIAWDAPRHKWHFERTSLDDVLRRAGFEVQIRKAVPSDTLFNCAASEVHNPSGSRWNLPFRLFRSLWRSFQVLRAVKRVGPDCASTLLVVAKSSKRSSEHD